MRRTVIACCAAIAPVTAAVGVAPPQLRAGVWSERMSMKIVTVDGAPAGDAPETQQVQSSEDCYSADDVADAQAFFSQGAIDQNCRDLRITAADGRIGIGGSCTTAGFSFAATGTGDYADAHYRMDVSLSAVAEGHLVRAVLTSTGTYLRLCTPDGPADRQK